MKNQSASLKKVALVTLLGGAVEWQHYGMWIYHAKTS